jgi:hypothetical protein
MGLIPPASTLCRGQFTPAWQNYKEIRLSTSVAASTLLIECAGRLQPPQRYAPAAFSVVALAQLKST